MSPPVRLLLVEDDLPTAKLLRHQLGDTHYATTHVATFGDALDYVDACHSELDVVLCDLRLPDSQATDTVKGLGRLTGRIPVVVLTGLDDDALGRTAIRHGAEDYVVKSADPSLLRRSIHYAMARHRLKKDLRSVVDRNADAVVVVGPDARVRYLNQAAEKMFGQRADELVGQPFGYDIPKRSIVLVDLNLDDEQRTAEIRTTDIEWDGEPCSLLSIRDVTDRMRAQELERQLMHADRLSAIGQLAAGVAHEINNPATFLTTNLDALSELLEAIDEARHVTRESVEELRRLLAEAKLGTKQIVACARGLNSLSRSNRRHTEPTNVNLIIEDATTLTRGEFRHHAELVMNLEAVPEVPLDRSAMLQVLVNLLINAAHAVIGQGKGHHEIRVGSHFEDDEIVVVVEDTGCGIPEQTVSQIFDPFFTTKDDGTGLGLSICADVVQRHRGKLEVESQLGKGSRFTVRLPARTELEPPRTTRTGESSTSSGRLRVLIIDDQHLVRRALARMLRAHVVVDVAHAGEALRLFESGESFDAVLCDVMMPDMDGVTLYEEVTRRFPDHAQRFIFVSGGAFTPRVCEFLDEVAAPVLAKPISPESVLSALAKVASKD